MPELDRSFDHPPAVEVRRSADKSLTSGAFTYVDFDQEQYDTAAQHDNSTNNTRLTCIRAGLYDVFATGFISGGASGRRLAIVRRNGSDSDYVMEEEGAATSSGFWGCAPSGIVRLALNDYLELGFFQDSGGALTLTGPNATFLAGVRFGWVYRRPTP